MSGIFADTFYWIALINPEDNHANDASRFDELLSGGRISTTDEVLAEVLTFSSADAQLRVRAVKTVRAILANGTVRVIPQSHGSFLAGSTSMRHGPTRDTV